MKPPFVPDVENIFFCSKQYNTKYFEYIEKNIPNGNVNQFNNQWDDDF
jgi:hypothetical protein